MAVNLVSVCLTAQSPNKKKIIMTFSWRKESTERPHPCKNRTFHSPQQPHGEMNTLRV